MKISEISLTCPKFLIVRGTGKYFSEAHILVSTNPQYDKRLFSTWKFQDQNMLRTWWEHVVWKFYCFFFVLTFRTIYVDNKFSTCSELGIFMFWICNSMNNLLSYCGLVDTTISAFEKDLPIWIKSTSRSFPEYQWHLVTNFDKCVLSPWPDTYVLW